MYDENLRSITGRGFPLSSHFLDIHIGDKSLGALATLVRLSLSRFLVIENEVRQQSVIRSNFHCDNKNIRKLWALW